MRKIKLMQISEAFIMRNDYKDMTEEQMGNILDDLCRVAEKYDCSLTCGTKLIEDDLD